MKIIKIQFNFIRGGRFGLFESFLVKKKDGSNVISWNLTSTIKPLYACSPSSPKVAQIYIIYTRQIIIIKEEENHVKLKPICGLDINTFKPKKKKVMVIHPCEDQQQIQNSQQDCGLVGGAFATIFSIQICPREKIYIR